MQSATALERHAGFFDPEGTGSVTIGQTYAGLRSLGVGLGWRLVLPVIINGFLGYLTQGKLSFVIAVRKIAQGKHPFDTGVFGDDGEIDEAAFAELARVVEASGGSLTAAELDSLIRSRGNRRPEMGKVAGPLGRWFSAREVALLLCLAADTKKVVGGRETAAITQRTLRRFYEGTLLPTLARRRRIRALSSSA
jgi:hypothetical protein